MLIQQLSQATNRKHKITAFFLPFVRGIHRSPVDSTQKWPVIRKAPSCCKAFRDVMGGKRRSTEWSAVYIVHLERQVGCNPWYTRIVRTTVCCCNIQYPSETYLKLVSREISSAPNLSFESCCSCIQDTALMLPCSMYIGHAPCNDLTTVIIIMDERHFERF